MSLTNRELRERLYLCNQLFLALDQLLDDAQAQHVDLAEIDQIFKAKRALFHVMTALNVALIERRTDDYNQVNKDLEGVIKGLKGVQKNIEDVKGIIEIATEVLELLGKVLIIFGL